MHLLDTITIAFAGFIMGNELALSAFVNPAVWQLENGPQAQVLSLLARSLGRVMPSGTACAWVCRPLNRSCIASWLGCPAAHSDADLGRTRCLHDWHSNTH
jgi:hypothetical protein